MKNVTALARATMLTTTFITVVTITGEYARGFKDGLAGMTGHHWVTKGLLAAVVFFASYAVFAALAKDDSPNVARSNNLVALCTVLNGLVLFGFFVMHFVQSH